jgi:hypothetical protein
MNPPDDRQRKNETTAIAVVHPATSRVSCSVARIAALFFASPGRFGSMIGRNEIALPAFVSPWS